MSKKKRKSKPSATQTRPRKKRARNGSATAVVTESAKAVARALEVARALAPLVNAQQSLREVAIELDHIRDMFGEVTSAEAAAVACSVLPAERNARATGAVEDRFWIGPGMAMLSLCTQDGAYILLVDGVFVGLVRSKEEAARMARLVARACGRVTASDRSGGLSIAGIDDRKILNWKTR